MTAWFRIIYLFISYCLAELFRLIHGHITAEMVVYSRFRRSHFVFFRLLSGYITKVKLRIWVKNIIWPIEKPTEIFGYFFWGDGVFYSLLFRVEPVKTLETGGHFAAFGVFLGTNCELPQNGHPVQNSRPVQNFIFFKRNDLKKEFIHYFNLKKNWSMSKFFN